MSLVLIIAAIGCTSYTLAKWSSTGGATAQSTYGPVGDSQTWNIDERYFDTEYVYNNDSIVGVAITNFSGINVEDVVIPEKINNYTVLTIKNTIFKDTTIKTLPVTLRIPATVTTIEDGAFASLTNLQKVIFDANYSGAASLCTCGSSVFAGCINLKNVYVYGNKNVLFGDYDFLGCMALTVAPQQLDIKSKFDNTLLTTYKKEGSDALYWALGGQEQDILVTYNGIEVIVPTVEEGATYWIIRIGDVTYTTDVPVDNIIHASTGSITYSTNATAGASFTLVGD